MTDPKDRFVRTYQGILVVGITIVAGFLSFHRIGQKNIWIDEGISMSVAGMPWRDFWATLTSMEINMWLYYFLFKFWILLGDSEFLIRSFSALFAIASVPVLYSLTKRLFGARAGLVSVLLLAVNAFLVEYAQEARGYALLLFLVVLSSYAFVRAVDDPADRKMLGAYVIVSALAVYTHVFAGFVLLAHALSLPFLPWERLRIRRFLLAGVLIAVLLTPLAYFVLAVGGGQISWILKPSVSQLKDLIMDLSGDAGHVKYLTIFCFLPCSITLVHAGRAFLHSGRSRDTWRFAFMLSWLVVPILLSFGISQVKPMFLNRYLIVSLPALAMVTGVGVSWIEDRYCRAIFLIFLVVLMVRSTVTQYYPKEKEENNRDSASYVASHARQGDGILFYRDGAMISFEYYWKRLNPSPGLLESVYPAKFGHYRYIDPPELTVSSLESLKEGYGRIWVVLRQNGKEFGFIPAALENHYVLQQERKYTGIEVRLYVRK